MSRRLARALILPWTNCTGGCRSTAPTLANLHLPHLHKPTFVQRGGDEPAGDDDDDDFDDDEVVSRRTRRSGDEVVTTTTTTYVDDPYDYGYGVYYDPWVPLVWCAILW